MIRVKDNESSEINSDYQLRVFDHTRSHAKYKSSIDTAESSKIDENLHEGDFFCAGHPSTIPNELLDSIFVKHDALTIKHQGASGSVIPGFYNGHEVMIKVPNFMISGNQFELKTVSRGATQHTYHLHKKAHTQVPYDILQDTKNELRTYNLLVNGSDLNSVDGQLISKSEFATKGTKKLIDAIHDFHNRKHPSMHHLMQILDFDLSVPCMVSYRYQGMVYDLIDEWLKSPALLPRRTELQINMKNNLDQFISQLIMGLMYMHSLNIAHLDIKILNIFYAVRKDKSFDFVIGDFGGCSDPGKTSIFQWAECWEGSPCMTLPLLPVSPNSSQAFPVYKDLYGFCTSVQTLIHFINADFANRSLQMQDLVFARVLEGGIGSFYGTTYKGCPLSSSSLAFHDIYKKLEIIREGILSKDHFQTRPAGLPEVTFTILPINNAQFDGMLKEYMDFCDEWFASRNISSELDDVKKLKTEMLAIKDNVATAAKMKSSYANVLSRKKFNNVPRSKKSTSSGSRSSSSGSSSSTLIHLPYHHLHALSPIMHGSTVRYVQNVSYLPVSPSPSITHAWHPAPITYQHSPPMHNRVIYYQ